MSHESGDQIRMQQAVTQAGQDAVLDHLAGDGGASVRGSKAVLVSGNTGHVWRNEVFWRTPAALPEQLGMFELYMTADRGVIAAQDDAAIAGGVVRGASLGARLVGGRFDIDATYGRILQTPGGIARPDWDFLISAGWRF